MENPEEVWQDTGVERSHDPNFTALEMMPQAVEMGVASGEGALTEAECGICCVSCDMDVQVVCGHHFCKACWKE